MIVQTTALITLKTEGREGCAGRSGHGAVSPQASFDTTQRIRSITREAKDNKRLRERLAFWKDTMRTRGAAS